MVSKGEKILVITRRLFDGDLRRHFVGEVQATSSAVARVQGYAFVFDETTKQFVRHDELRTRIIPLIDALLVVIVLPDGVSIEDIRYSWDADNRRIITDENQFKMNISEFGPDR